MARRSIEGKRTHVIVPATATRQLDNLAANTGMTVSEHIRRAIQRYLEWINGGMKS